MASISSQPSRRIAANPLLGFLALLLAALLSAPAHAQCPSIWTESAALGTRNNPSMAFDSDRGRVVLFGGQNQRGDAGDTWEWNGAQWTRRSAPPAPAPSPREGAAMAYDPIRHRTVLFGGTQNDFQAVLNDTWEWDGTSWTMMSSGGPAPRGFAAAAFDAARGRVVMYGGFNGTIGFSDTWEWTGLNWTLVSAVGPPARGGHTMAYDSARSRTVVFGG